MTWINPKGTSGSIARGAAGFSLIEMMVVVAIIVVMATMAMPSVTSYFQVSINSATRDLASVIKESYNSAVLTGNVYRVVFDLKENTYWVESGPKNILLDTKESKEKEERVKRITRSTSTTSSGEFKLDKTVTRKKIALPAGIEFEDVFTQQSNEPIQQGTAYAHFFPQGLSEQTIIHLKDQAKHKASLVITPILGSTDLYNRYVTVKEVFEQ